MLIARQAGLKIFPVSYFSQIDLSIDGADEVDLSLRLIKGGGAAHTNEKIVHAMSSKFLCVVDPSKLVSQLGEKFAVPIEVIEHAVEFVKVELSNAGASGIVIRSAVKKDGPVITDNGNFIIDARFTNFDPESLESKLNNIPGVVDNGIFAKYRPHEVIIGESTGVRTMKR
jgi:ribose 5-phosphate isomerase A